MWKRARMAVFAFLEGFCRLWDHYDRAGSFLFYKKGVVRPYCRICSFFWLFADRCADCYCWYHSWFFVWSYRVFIPEIQTESHMVVDLDLEQDVKKACRNITYTSDMLCNEWQVIEISEPVLNDTLSSSGFSMVERRRLELPTSYMRSKRSPSWANTPRITS